MNDIGNMQNQMQNQAADDRGNNAGYEELLALLRAIAFRLLFIIGLLGGVLSCLISMYFKG